jgi:hypothetical protein
LQQVKWYVAALVCCLAACTSAAQPAAVSAPPERTGYVLSGYNVGSGFRNNALSLVDMVSWQVVRRVEIPHSWAKSMARDPNGRVWVGFSGSSQESDTRLHVYSAAGDLVKTLHPCIDPEAGISFAAGRAFVACSDNGFRGKLAVIRLESLEIEQVLELSVPNSHLLLTASAANDAAVLIAGMTDGPQEGRYAVVTVVDPRSLTVRAQLELGLDSDVWRIISDAERFYLLNVASWHQAREQASDVFVLDPSDPPQIRSIAVAPSPLWGAIDGGAVYAYHNPTWNQPNGDPARRLSRVDLSTGQVQRWPLPDNWNASDLSVVDGRVMLARWSGRSGRDDGLYHFDSVSGDLTKQLDIVDASGLIPPLRPQRN